MLLIGSYTQTDLILFLVIAVRTGVLLSVLGGLIFGLHYIGLTALPWRFFRAAILPLALLYGGLQVVREVNQTTVAAIRWSTEK